MGFDFYQRKCNKKKYIIGLTSFFFLIIFLYLVLKVQLTQELKNKNTISKIGTQTVGSMAEL